MSNTDTQFGLSNKTIKQISNVLMDYPAVEKAILYGSRAKGNYRKGSDIDLTLLGEQLTHDDLFKINRDLDDLPTPYQIDLSLFDAIELPSLIEHIQRAGQVFYKRKL